MNPTTLGQLTPAQQASYAAFLARMGASAVPTPAPQPVVMAAAPVPAPPPINPSLAFRVAHWWDHSHQFRDTMLWIWAHRPFQGKPPAPPAPPSGGSGSGAGGGAWNKFINAAIILIFVLGFLSLGLGYWAYFHTEENLISPEGRARTLNDAQASATRSRAADALEIIKECRKFAEANPGQSLPTDCTGGTAAASTAVPQFNLGMSGTCSNIGTARRGNQMVPIYGSGIGCTSSLNGSMSFFKGNFTVTSGNAYVIMKDCTTWDDMEQEHSVPQGTKLSGCFRAKSDSSTTLTSN